MKQYNLVVNGYSVGITDSWVTVCNWYFESKSPNKVKEIWVMG